MAWLHEVILRIMRFILEDVPGGYLCRGQEGDLKYMLAFDTARGALKWCLVRMCVCEGGGCMGG